MHLRIAAAFLFIVSFAIAAGEPLPPFVVNTTALFSETEGELTLPQAVVLSNASTFDDVRIHFQIEGAGPHKIELEQPLFITRKVIIDGTTQLGYAGTPLIEISYAGFDEPPGAEVAAAIGKSAAALMISTSVERAGARAVDITGDGVVIRALSITDSQYGIHFLGGSGHAVEACYIGVTPGGTALGNEAGIFVEASGIFSPTNIRIGTNGDGVGDAAEGNVIGNNLYGILMGSFSSEGDFPLNVLIAGNRIGVLPNGTAAGNGFVGILSVGASTIDILNNIVANTGDTGIAIEYGSQFVVQGNRVVGNGFVEEGRGEVRAGLFLLEVQDALIGTDGDGVADVAERNIFSGNGTSGIIVLSEETISSAASRALTASTTRIAGNYIGLDSDGSALGNGTAEVDEEIQFFIPLQKSGINLFGSPNVIIGANGDGSAGEANEGNLISSNAGYGIAAGLFGFNNQPPQSQSVGNRALIGDYTVLIAGNTIGAGPGGVVRGNTLDGIYVEDSEPVMIGGDIAGSGNTIVNNGGNGVTVAGDAIATILGNSISSNAKIGIDLGDDGVTANDANLVFPPEGEFPGSVNGDPDFGPNGLSNTPVITSISADRKTVTGTLNASVNESSFRRAIGRAVETEEPNPATSMYRVEFFSNPDASPNQGQRFLGSTEVTISDLVTCTAAFTATLTTPAVPGSTVTATATRLHAFLPETSEFSVPNAVSRVPALTFASEPAFTPAAPTTDDVVTFTANASITGITVTWDFGDGSATADGETVTHKYAAPGQYSVVVTLLDAPTGVSISKTLTVPVIAGATPPVKPSISDFRVRSLIISLDTNPNRDVIVVNGRVSLPKGFVLTGKTLELNIGGVIRTFTLNKKGKARVGAESVKFSVPKGVRNQDYSVTVSLKKGTFAETLKTNALAKDANGLPSSIAVRSRFNDKDLLRVVPVKFKTRGTKSTTKFGVF